MVYAPAVSPARDQFAEEPPSGVSPSTRLLGRIFTQERAELALDTGGFNKATSYGQLV
jgi:hypothetical protein